jgi:hypothetical protein
MLTTVKPKNTQQNTVHVYTLWFSKFEGFVYNTLIHDLMLDLPYHFLVKYKLDESHET